MRIGNTIFIDDTDVHIDNITSDETQLVYKDQSDVVYSISIPFVLSLIENAIENLREDGNIPEITQAALQLIRETLNEENNDSTRSV